MLNLIFDVIKYPFLKRAFLAGILISICVAILGVSLVLKKYSMIGDGLSHVGFSAFSISSAMNWAPFLISIPLVVVAAILLLLLRENSKIKSDALIGLVSNGCLSIGIILISITKGINSEVLNYMFGSILALNNLDLILCVIISAVTIFVFVFSYNKIFSITFDEDFTKAVGVNVRLYNILTAVLTALMIVVGMKMVGALLISSLIIFPGLSVSMIFRSYKKIVIFAAIDSVFCFVVGFLMSYVFLVPTGALVVFVNLIIFIICFLIKKLKDLKFFKVKFYGL